MGNGEGKKTLGSKLTQGRRSELVSKERNIIEPMDAKKELGEEGVLVQSDVPQVQNQGKEISRDQMKATFPLPNGEGPSKMILARDRFQYLHTVQDGKERKVRNGELEAIEVET